MTDPKLNIRINIEFDDLGDKAGIARSIEGGDYVNITIDPKRCCDEATLRFALRHELIHASENILQRWKNHQYNVAQDMIINDILIKSGIGGYSDE